MINAPDKAHSQCHRYLCRDVDRSLHPPCEREPHQLREPLRSCGMHQAPVDAKQAAFGLAAGERLPATQKALPDDSGNHLSCDWYDTPLCSNHRRAHSRQVA